MPVNHVVVTGAVEGPADEAVLARLVGELGALRGSIYGKKGKDYLRRKLRGYNQAARRSPWVVLVDLNSDGECGAVLQQAWLPQPAPMMCFRVAVRMVEAWLIADSERFSTFFSVARSRIPQHAEGEANPKQMVVGLARRSRRRRIREDMVPRPGSGRKVGPAYTSRLIEFASNRDSGWRPNVAAQRSESLSRCLRCIRRLINQKI